MIHGYEWIDGSACQTALLRCCQAIGSQPNIFRRELLSGVCKPRSIFREAGGLTTKNTNDTKSGCVGLGLRFGAEEITG
jgi:hypothetical protein